MLSVAFFLSALFFALMTKLMKFQFINMNQTTNFECGFNSKSSSLIPFSSQFFLIAILFLVFDLEIVLFVPSILIGNLSVTSTMSSISLMTAMYILFIVEWKLNMIKWSK